MNKVLIASVVLFVAGCCLPALEFKNSNSTNDAMFGANALAVGWSGIFAGIFAWYANPAWLLGAILVARRKRTPALFFGIVAIALACTTFSVIGRELPADEGGVKKMTVIKLLPGCYVWMTGLVTLPLVAFFKWPVERAEIAT